MYQQTMLHEGKKSHIEPICLSYALDMILAQVKYDSGFECGHPSYVNLNMSIPLLKTKYVLIQVLR